MQVFDEPVAAPGDRTSVLNSCGNSEIAVVTGDRLVRGQVYCIDLDSDEAEASWEHRLAVLHSQLEGKLLPKVFEECSRRCGGFGEGVAPTTLFCCCQVGEGRLRVSLQRRSWSRESVDTLPRSRNLLYNYSSLHCPMDFIISYYCPSLLLGV